MKRTALLVCFSLLCIIARAQMSGCYTVGNLGGENYSSLSNAGGFFSALNATSVTGNIIVKITSNINETGSVQLANWAGGYTIRIVPATASVKTLSYTGACASAMLRFNGTDNLEIDGRQNSAACANAPTTGNYLTFQSSCASFPVIQFDGDCENVKLRNITLLSENTSTTNINGGALSVRANQPISGSDNFTVYDCNIGGITNPSGLFFCALVNAPSTAGVNLTGLVVKKNNFINFKCKGIHITSGTGKINGSVVSNNSFYAFAPLTGPGVPWEYSAVEIETGSGHTVQANYIGGQSANCGGNKMNIAMATGEQIALIRITATADANGTFNVIDSNVVRNIDMLGSTSTSLLASVMRIEEGNHNIGSVYGNTIGDINIDATIPASASIIYTEGCNNASNTFRAIFSTSSGTVNVENNVIGGLLFQQGFALGHSANILYSLSSMTNFRNNKIGGVTNNIVKKSGSYLRLIYSDVSNSPVDITGNIISGITMSNSFATLLYGIRVSNGTGLPTIFNNQFSNIVVGDFSNTSRTEMIAVENPSALINLNSISNVSVNSTYTSTQFYGIRLTCDASSLTISRNTISDIVVANTSTIQSNFIGISTSGTSTFNINSNFIKNVAVKSTTNTSYLRGVDITNATLNKVYNNAILLSNTGQTNDILVYGIYDDAAAGTNQIWFNTVDIRGVGTGSRRSACYYRTNSCTRSIQNNIFNNRRSGGSGGHYAVYHNTTGGTETYNYNLLYAEESTAKLVRYTSDRNFSAWQGLSFDANGVTGLTAQNLVDPVTGFQTTILGNDIANPSLGITADRLLIGRPLGIGPDIGAHEISTATLLSPLPIELSYFGVECNEGKTKLKWTTLSESNTSHFVVERSADGTNWKSIRSVSGNGHSTGLHNYEYEDESSLSEGYWYYRLKQVDKDSIFAFSKAIQADCGLTEDTDCIRVFPNPSAGKLFLTNRCTKGTVNKLQLFDWKGSLVYESDVINCGEGNHHLIYEDVGLPNGFYLMKLLVGNTYRNFKIIIDHNK